MSDNGSARKASSPRPVPPQGKGVDRALREKIDCLPREPGVYLMKDRAGRVLYVGKANDLRARVRSYFAEGKSDDRVLIGALTEHVADVEVIVVGNEKEALLLENELIRLFRPPFNAKQKNGKGFVYLRIDPRQSHPRLEVVRRVRDDGARYFGPYPLAHALRQTLRVINRAFRLRTCADHDTARHHGRPCLLCQISRFPVPSIYDIPEDEYRRNVEDAIAFLEGRRQGLVESMKARMREAAARQDFEEAARLRDQIRAIEKTLLPQRIVKAEHPDPTALEILERLRSRLGLRRLPIRIECFDVSHFAKAATVASTVALTNGVPEKSRYLRFRISLEHAGDDLRSLYEAVSRRLLRGDLPDLFVIDGGKGQLGAALSALKDAGIEGVDVVALAKERDERPERLYLPGRKNPLVLSQSSPEMLVLMRARDEAHRLAHTYQGKLMRKEALRSWLEDVPGIGKKRARALLRHFGSTEAIRAAGVDELAQVVGPALASRLYRHLHGTMEADHAPHAG